MSQETKNYQYERNDFNTYGVRGSASGGGTEVIANPTLAGTEGALTGLQVGDTKYKVDSGMSQTDADARYLKLAGGTMTGNIRMSNSGYKILTPNGEDALVCKDTGSQLGSITKPAQINSSTPVYRSNGVNSYTMLDTSNGLALSGGTMTGEITGKNGDIIKDSEGKALLTKYSYENVVIINNGSTADITLRTGSSGNINHRKTNTDYIMYDESNGVGYTTTAPTANNTKGGLVIVVLTSEPSTYYNGYYYIIAPST